MNTTKHKVNHIDISPDSESFMFLYRWFYNGKKFTRLMVADKNGKNLRIICGDNESLWDKSVSIVNPVLQFATGYYYGFMAAQLMSRIILPILIPRLLRFMR